MRRLLEDHQKRLGALPLSMHAGARAGMACLEAAGWQINLARQYLDPEAEKDLIRHGEEAGLPAAAQALFSCALVNPSERRPALHWALRAPNALSGDAESVRMSVMPALEFAGALRRGEILAPNGRRYDCVLHIGIGGSDFGPRLIADAFSDLSEPGIGLRFAANVDPFDLDRALTGLNPETTLIIGVSKSFGTEETLYNLNRARRWLRSASEAAAQSNLALITASPDRAKAWLGAGTARIFEMPESVGGRFSLWSAASLACMISLGPETFRSILRGAAEMDAHVRGTDLEQNAAMRLALLDYWNTTIRKRPMRALLAYANRLRMLPTYLQQLEMESNGKSVGPQGEMLMPPTAPALWGGEGSVGQHSYHQWLHQGSHEVPCEFILAPDAGRDQEGLISLMSHALAQAEVLANGRSLSQVREEEPGLSEHVALQKVHAGGRPSIFLTHARFGPEAFGALISLYEHRTYFAGRLWGLNPFDQWGVERGKTMAGRIRPALQGAGKDLDPVTAALIRQIL